ncbi:uncharacterized protein [Rutidosis leptorrhynchoides]|uniref:uncharacterized protein n=1 Tax=Rutidosis leptorrhynchoides TaxID=125765 RepID=UPI003A99C2B2
MSDIPPVIILESNSDSSASSPATATDTQIPSSLPSSDSGASSSGDTLSVIRFGKRGKLNPRYVRPFEITERIGPVAYRLNLPQQLSKVQNMFHLLNLKNCLAKKDLTISLEEIQIEDKLHFIEELVEVMDREIKQLKKSNILIVKFQLNARRGPEFMWESEDHQMTQKYPHIFTTPSSTID